MTSALQAKAYPYVKLTMPRQPRLDAPGLLQHVMARGIERRKIFLDDKDRESFLERFANILEETQTQCYVYPVKCEAYFSGAWALIPNHLNKRQLMWDSFLK